MPQDKVTLSYNYYASSQPLSQGRQVRPTMRTIIAQFTFLLLCVLIRPSSSQCKSRALTVEEYLDLADTELLGSDFCATLSEAECFATAEETWADLNEEEWSLGQIHYEEKGVWHPYGFCHVGPGMTGNERKTALMNSLNASIAELTSVPATTFTTIRLNVDKLKLDSKRNVAVLSNTEDRFCGVIRLPEPFACNIADLDSNDENVTNIIIQPLHQYMKIGSGTFDAMREIFDDTNNVGSTDLVFDFTLCPGAAEEIGIHSTQSDRDITEGFVEWAIRETNNIMCSKVYENRVTVSFARGDPDLSNDPDTLTIKFGTAEDSSLDFFCSVGLVKGVASLPTICFVELERESEAENDDATYVTQSGIPNYKPIFDAGITGEGQIVAVSDTGLDINNCYFEQSIFPSSRQNNGRLKVVQYISHADSRDDNNGHGTHVCGTIAGYSQEGSRGNGVAKNAKIAFMDIGVTGESFLRIPPDIELLDTGRGGGYADNAHIHSVSWGTPVTDVNRKSANGYTTRARNFDNYMLKNDDFLIVVAAGNDGQFNVANSVGTPATAKNVISVGAHLNDVLSMNRVAAFSSRGPTQDGRRKPDLLAPGQSLYSAAGNSVCSLTRKSGTSMATPATSGSAALIREYFEEGWWPEGKKGSGDSIQPSGALVKAILMNGAQWVTSVDNPSQYSSTVQRYDYSQGFGRISLVDSIYIAKRTNVFLDGAEDIIQDGDKRVYTRAITRAGGCSYPEFRATLVWTDEGAVPSCRNCLVNDLDLLVIKKGNRTSDTVFYPNGENRRDNVNNAERVIVPFVQEGDVFEVRVEGTNLANNEQKYALVMTGCLNFVDSRGFIFEPPEQSGAEDIKTRSIYTVAIVVGGAIFALLL
uniref:subtilisin n=1 Tax=Helicotheca tamesis TaxID=374047 RepID=A0A7S2HNE7_9STRA